MEGYKNKGQYPTLFMNGCQVGDFNLVATFFGEDWIVAKDKGAIGFIGTVAMSLLQNLRRYTQLFYEVGYDDPLFVNKGLGDIQKEVGRRFMLNAKVHGSRVSPRFSR
ncbi:MAG: C25 family cysteine peptidase [Chryseolinea sp.]